MSYVVLARKYRPKGFDALMGQEHVVQALSNALTQGRLHHAYLFTGTRGVGKTTVSRILAKALNCVGPDGRGGVTARPCGVCAACTAIDAGRFVDYVELDAASNRGVDEISQLLDQAVYKPVVGRYKVYMIDEVHMLSTTAFNAMLKTLEEPPDYLKFVLATTDPQKVPPTVLSRCLQFNLRPMAPDTVQAHLAQVLAEEQVPAEPAALRLLARAARGSMRDALSLTDQAIAYGAGALAEAGVRQMLGAVDRGHVVRIVEALAAGDGAALVATADALHALGIPGAGTLDELAQLLQELAVLQAVPDAADPTDPDTETSLRLAPLLEADELQLYYSMALHGRADLPLAPDERSGLVMALLRMLAFRLPGPARHVPPTAPAAATPRKDAFVMPASVAPLVRVTEVDAVASVPVPPTPEPASVPVRVPVPVPVPTHAATFDGGSPADRWAALVTQLDGAGRITALARELALQSDCVAIVDAAPDAPQVWQLRVESETLRASAQQDKLQRALTELLGRPVRIDLAAAKAVDSPAIRATAERDRRQQAAEQRVRNDPFVVSLLARFPTARLVPGSIKPV